MTDLSIEQIEFRVRCGAGLALLAVIGCFAWNIVCQRGMVLKAAEQMALRHSRTLAENSDKAFSQTDAMVRTLQREIRAQGGLGRVDRARLLLEMRRQMESAPQVGAMFVVDAAGEMRLNSGKIPFKQVNVADREYFRKYLAIPGLQLSFGNPHLSRLTTHWRFNMMRPLNGPQEPFGGLIVAGIETEFFGNLFSSAALGPRGCVVLVGTDGVPLVSAPCVARPNQMDLKGTLLFREKLPNFVSGIYHARSKFTDGQPLIVSYHRLARFPVVALVLLNQDDVLAPWAPRAATLSALGIGLCLGIVLLARAVLCRLHRQQALRPARQAAPAFKKGWPGSLG
jgi:two-component system, cell cycle sensor histidine kinase and response regulator CckA